jgi:hypothetical protein
MQEETSKQTAAANDKRTTSRDGSELLMADLQFLARCQIYFALQYVTTPLFTAVWQTMSQHHQGYLESEASAYGKPAVNQQRYVPQTTNLHIMADHAESRSMNIIR